jgi:type I restriction enzyme S subunit
MGKGNYSDPAPFAEGVFDQLPKDWRMLSLEAATSAARPICYGILMPKENVAAGVLYVKVRDMKGDRIDLSGLQRTSPEIAAQYARASLREGDLLLSIRGTYGRIAVIPKELDGGNITQDSARLAISSLMSRDFVRWAIRSQQIQHYFKRVARGVAVKGVNIGDVRPTPIPLPSLPEQLEIVRLLDAQFEVIERNERELDAALKRSEALRQAILKKAFTGRLVPQVATDEPASTLLARLRTERAAAPASKRKPTLQP